MGLVDKQREHAEMPAGFGRLGGRLVLRSDGVHHRSLLPCETLHPGNPFSVLALVSRLQCRCQGVVYLYRAGNSVARKSGTIPPYHDRVRGTLPWYRTCFSTSWCCWYFCGSASCCIIPGQTSVPQGIRGHPSLCRRRASAPATRSRFLASPARPPVPPVRRPPSTDPSRPGARHPVSCPRGDGRARWTPRSISARIRTVRIRAG